MWVRDRVLPNWDSIHCNQNLGNKPSSNLSIIRWSHCTQINLITGKKLLHNKKAKNFT